MSRIFIIYGVSGCGKSTVGKALATRLQLPFFDADDFHPPANIAKMAGGNPLTDQDRLPWLQSLASLLSAHKNTGAILACSALKESYRKLLASDSEIPIHWVLLEGSFELIRDRLNARQNHFMGSTLLEDQFSTLEIPDYGVKLSVKLPPANIVDHIIQQTMTQQTPTFGIIGLGVMGKALALNVVDHRFPLSVFNREVEGETGLVEEFLEEIPPSTKVQGFTDLNLFIDSLAAPRSVFLMIKAGSAVDSVIDALLPLLSPNDTILDGGNSHFTDTQRRIKICNTHHINFLGFGGLGGKQGARFGPSIMPGGNRAGFESTKKILTSIAANDKDGHACCAFIGKGAAGHFIKMVHNGIEYAEMQLLAEIYDVLKPHLKYEEIAACLESWNAGTAQSYLLEITTSILQKKEGDHYLLDVILDKAGNKGTGSWGTKAALELGSVNSMMSDAVFARYLSSFKEQRQHLAIKINHHPSQLVPLNTDILRHAYEAARLLNHIQGFELMRLASTEYGWELDLSEIARIWTNGCIIRSELMETLVHKFKETTSLLAMDSVLASISQSENDLRATLSHAISQRVPVPVFTSAWNYWLGITRAQSPANLIQAQRDFFGAHTYQRNDDNSGAFHHSEW